MSKRTKWHKGPPPSVGWWPASFFRLADQLRWWNGKCWSMAAHESWTEYEASAMATQKAKYQSEIEWTDRPASWPKRSRT